jgi:hypothetical protein
VTARKRPRKRSPPPGTSAAVHEALDRAIDAVEASGLRYAIVGGLAVAAHGAPRATRDVDLYVEMPEGVRATLSAALRTRGFDVPAMLEELERFGVFRSRLATSGVFLDVFDAGNPLGEAVISRRRELDLAGRHRWFASAEDIAVLKAFSDRARDAEDLALLLAPGQSIDLDYVRSWAAALDRSIGGDEVTERLARALDLAGRTK